MFKLPLTEFTPARNALAASLKKSGHREEAESVKALAKPPISAWAVNQLYWTHRETVDQLIETGQRFRQASQSAGKNEIAESGNARRKVISDLSRLATELLLNAGHSVTPELMRRITTTLEAISVYASFKDSPSGRLTADLDPPGFDALAGWMPQPKVTQTPEKRSSVVPFESPRPQQQQEARRAKIALAETSLSNAERALSEARLKTHAAESSLKTAVANARDAGNDKREAEERLKRATAISEEAERRARDAAAEEKDAAAALKDAERAVKKASDELQSLLRK